MLSKNLSKEQIQGRKLKFRPRNNEQSSWICSGSLNLLNREKWLGFCGPGSCYLLVTSFGIFHYVILLTSCWAGCGWLPHDLNGLTKRELKGLNSGVVGEDFTKERFKDRIQEFDRKSYVEFHNLLHSSLLEGRKVPVQGLLVPEAILSLPLSAFTQVFTSDRCLVCPLLPGETRFLTTLRDTAFTYHPNRTTLSGCYTKALLP